MPWYSGLQVHGTCMFPLVLLMLNSDVLFSSYCDGLLLGLAARETDLGQLWFSPVLGCLKVTQ